MIKTEILKVDSENPQPDIIQQAAKIILNGGLVAFPTDTLYGLGTNLFDVYSVKKVFEVKNRPPEKPLIALIGSEDDLDSLVTDVPTIGKKFIENHWPGPLTIIFKACEHIPKVVLAGGDTIAVRMPKSKISLALLAETGVPLTSPSANLSGEYSPMTAQDVYNQLNGKIDLILDGGKSNQTIPSTLVDVTVDPPKVLRPGPIKLNELE
jgi:L-threonylcarbamoyladenylate synthase